MQTADSPQHDTYNDIAIRTAEKLLDLRQPGSIAFWDNRAVQHYAASDYYPHKRILRRVTLSGDKPFYEPASSRRIV